MEKIGIIDIGSNSITLIIILINKEKKYFKIIDTLKESVRLGEGVNETLLLNKDRMKFAMYTLRMFKKHCDINNVNEIIAVATAAVRKAKNKYEFINQVKNETGIDVRSISGREEAVLDYIGVVNSLSINDGIIMDIGGGSTELLLVKDRELQEIISLPFGTLDISQQFNISNKMNQKTEKELNVFMDELYSSVDWLKKANNTQLIGVGGTIRSIGKIDRRSIDYPINISHNYQMNYNNVNDIYEMAKYMILEERKNIKGLSRDRAELFVGGVTAVRNLMKFCNINKLIVSGYGLREGIAFKYLGYGKNSYVKDVLDASIMNTLKLYDINETHAYYVYKILKKLCSELKELLNISIDTEKIIKTAALLHDCGINIRYYNHQAHSYYMILNSGLKGLTHKELLMSAWIAALHKPKKFKPDSEYIKILSKEDIDIVKKIGILLQITESLNKGNSEIIKDVKCEIKDTNIIINTVRDSDVELEISNAMLAQDDFYKIFKKELVIE